MLKSLLLISLLASPVLADEAQPPDVTKTQLEALRQAAKCLEKASPWRPWCIAADFEKGTAADLPKGKVLVGMTIELETGKDTTKALSDKVSLTALAIGADGKAKVTNVQPENAAEQKVVAEAVANLTLVFKDKAATVKLPKELADHFKTLKGSYATTKKGSEWTWTAMSPTRMRKVGKHWVVIEAPGKGNGIFATILTDGWN